MPFIALINRLQLNWRLERKGYFAVKFQSTTRTTKPTPRSGWAIMKD